jgi:transcriptional regulator
MYLPKEYSAKDQNQIDDFIAAHPFISLITTSEDGFPMAIHLPIITKKVDDT